MLIYIAVAAMPAMLALAFGDLTEKCKKRNYLIVCGILLFFFMALRSYSVGSVDTRNYMNGMSQAIHANSWKDFYNPKGVEVGFQMYAFLLSRVFDNAQWIVVISSALFVFLTFWFIYKNSEDVALSATLYITLGVMTFCMQGMRQAIAMCLCLIAYELAQKRKLILFALIIVLASLFHQTAIIFIIVYFAPLVKFNFQSFVCFSGVSILAILGSNTIISIANEVFDKEYELSVDSGGFFAVATYVVIILVALLFNKKLKDGDHAESMMFYITFLGLTCYVMRYFSVQQAERISFYFLFGQMILLPNSMQHLTTRERQISKLAAYVLAICLFLYRLNGSDFVPYEFFWQTPRL